MERPRSTQEPTSPSTSYRARRLALAAAGLVLVAALGAVAYRRYIAAREPNRTAQQKAPAGTFHLTDEQLRSVGTEPVVTMTFHSEELTDGKIAFNGDTLTPVYSPYSGRVTRVIAALGAVVKRGQPLFELEATEYAQGETDLLAALAQLKLGNINEERKHAAYDAHGGSLQDWQQSQNDLAVAKANLAAVRNRLRILGLADETIDAIGERGTPDALIPVTAPIAGLVVDRQLGPGQVLTAGGATALYTIADLSTVWLVANVREAEAPQVRLGQDVTVHVLALPDRDYKARLNFVGAAVDPTSRRVPVHADNDSANGALKPEMYANFAIVTSPHSGAPAVSQQAVIHEGEPVRVWVMLTAHDVGLRQIRIGRQRDGRVEVLDGVTAGQRVVTRGALFIDRAARAD